MSDTYWVLMVAGHLKTKFGSREEATEAGKRFLLDHRDQDRVPIQEFTEKGLGKRGRMIFRLGNDKFHYFDTEWVD